MNRLLKTTTTRVFALVLAMLLLGALLPFVMRGTASPITSVVGLITGPLQGLSASLSNALADFTSHFASAAELQARLDERDEELAELRAMLVEYHDAIARLDFYAEFLDLRRENPDFRFAESAIIGIDSIGDSIAAFTLNRGSASGISAGNPVLMGQYLVGVIAEAGLTTSTVHTIVNPRVNIAVYETLTGEIGFANASPELAARGLTSIPQLDRTTAITSGYLIATSGLGGIYPRDLILGVVTDVIDGDQGFYVSAIIEPAVDLTSLRDVLVLVEQ